MAEEKDYKDTIHLPRTAFPMKANLPKREPERVAWWEAERTYHRMVEARKDAPRFLLHDGPPYANNHIHQGHILNKVLKDIVVKHRALAGHRTPFVPGWDCHGLPIELQVDKKLGAKKREMSVAEFRRACREYAERWLDVQREEFRRLGVLGRFERPYRTMDYAYEAQTVRELAKFARAGSLYKGKKPVHWCIRDATALAEAEVEYEEHSSPSIYVAFDVAEGLGALPEAVRNRRPALVIWTTTPWTLPANRAVAYHPDFEYVAYDLDGRALIVAKALLHRFLAEVAPDALKLADVSEATSGVVSDPVAALAEPSRILAHLDGETLGQLKYRHPFSDALCPVLPAEHVTLEQGTGLVHTAPGHGVEDYQLGLAFGLEIYNPVDDRGRYIPDLPPAIADLAGVKVFEANPRIIEKLAESGALLSPKDLTITHSYPHCWRCGQPVIFRATYQWFISMEHGALREKALAEIERVRWIPAWGKERIHGMVAARPDWCISRQRAWGVPIPVFYCEACGEAIADPEVMERVADRFEEEGADAWFERSVAELAGELRCPKCGASELRKEEDILDVWFDSGVSYAAVCERDPELGSPVDLYLEGSDQHRGWFHSTLLCAVGTRGRAPYEAVLTHGFVVDGEGKKLSKKKGNYTPPEKVLQTRGAEILRLWVAAEDYRGDIRYSDQILDRLSDAYRKIRNTLRYALGNLHGFDPTRHAASPQQWHDLDRWAYGRLQDWVERIRAAYDAYEFHLVYHATVDLCAVDLSAVYFDVLKDRLYCSGEDWPERRAAQTVLWQVATTLASGLAPILSFTCEETWQTLREEHPAAKLPESVFLSELPAPDRSVPAPDFTPLLEVREAVLRELEIRRKAKAIGKSLEAKVRLTVPAALEAKLAPWRDFLPDWFIVSQVELLAGEALSVEVLPAEGERCQRCWKYAELGSDPAHPTLCPRCTRAVTG
ncbi:MAG: isoleucine--tRNA ligase [Deltaproteobacteria bacterium]|nr:MAG: isoleucine--tRNA ligase [Deltaproteobacteria bacterium]